MEGSCTPFLVLRAPELDTELQVGPRMEKRAEFSPLSCCFECSPGHNWLSGLQIAIAGSCPASHLQAPPNPLQGLLSMPSSPSLCWHLGWPQHLALLSLRRFPQTHFSNLCRSFWMASCPPRHANHTAQLGGFHTLAEGALKLPYDNWDDVTSFRSITSPRIEMLMFVYASKIESKIH